ncbi:MAG: MGMT family protein [Phycisphaerales bacterium]|nr:MGMT family protein [Phycisphaerales bacterium]MCB9864196.1 MGMT family protein [Phycisphaerales bacterium]
MPSHRNSAPRRQSAGRRPRREAPPTLQVDDVAGPHPAILRLCRLIASIPRGRICTYGMLASGIGWPRHARLVGRFLAESPLAEMLPWHRVVGADGRIRPRTGSGPNRQRSRLEKEGVGVNEQGRIRIKAYLWSPSP